MTQRNSIHIKASLQKLFPSRWLRQIAKETGAVRRTRKIDVATYVWSFVFSFANSATRSIAAARAAYIKETGTDVEESSFYQRLTPAFVSMLERILNRGLAEVSLGVGEQLGGLLKTFQDVLITDGSLVRLHDALAKWFPNARTNISKAAAKLHLVMNVSGRSNQSVRITNGRRHDGPVFKVGKWAKQKLFLFDLGYYRNNLFAQISHWGGFFVSRLKANANPLVVSVNGKIPADLLPYLVGARWQDALALVYKYGLLQLDAQVRLADGHEYRAVAIKNVDTPHFHTYLTNLSGEVLTVEAVQAVYSLRWLIELLFKELKTNYRMADIRTKKPVVAKALLYVTLIALVVSRNILAKLRAAMGARAHQIPPLRWANLFRSIAREVLALLLTRNETVVQYIENKLGQALRATALDPNSGHRKLLLPSVEEGMLAYAR